MGELEKISEEGEEDSHEGMDEHKMDDRLYEGSPFCLRKPEPHSDANHGGRPGKRLPGDDFNAMEEGEEWSARITEMKMREGKEREKMRQVNPYKPLNPQRHETLMRGATKTSTGKFEPLPWEVGGERAIGRHDGRHRLSADPEEHVRNDASARGIDMEDASSDELVPVQGELNAPVTQEPSCQACGKQIHRWERGNDGEETQHTPLKMSPYS